MKLKDFVNELTKINAKELLLVGPLAKTGELQGQNRPSGIIFVDGGAKLKADTINIWSELPTFSVGDGDSISSELVDTLDCKLDPNKDQTDLYHALLSIPSFIQKINCIGLSGGEKDQELAVLGECYHYINENKFVESINISGPLSLFQAGKVKIEHNGGISLFSLEKTLFTIKGECQFPLLSETEIAPLSSRSFRNRASGLVEITSTRPFFIYRY